MLLRFFFVPPPSPPLPPNHLHFPSLPLPLLRRPNLHCKLSTSSHFPTSSVTPPLPIEEELPRLLHLLPDEMRSKLQSHPELPHLIEIVMDLGRPPIARFPKGDFLLSDLPISSDHIRHAASQVGDFASDNRAGISRTLHRISAIRNRKGGIVGLTCRVGRAVLGSAHMLRDLVKDGGSLLLIGPPGVGKTTIIRDIARILADDYKKRVMIVDTSNEIGGDGDIPHAGIGSARRLQVPNCNMQHKVLIEAVENHMPQVIVIDEIGTKLEAMAASTIAQRGIQLVATAHGVTIENLIMNPSLEMLVGGIQSVTLGDEEASRRGLQKTVLERKGPSTFTSGAEIISKTELQVHRDLEATVDALLAGRSPKFEVRKIDPKGSTYETLGNDIPDGNHSQEEDVIVSEDHFMRTDEHTADDKINFEFEEKMEKDSRGARVGFHLFVYGITEASVLQAMKQLGMDEMFELTDNISEADAFLALHSKIKRNSQIQAVAKSRDIPIFITKTNSLTQIMKALRALINEHVNGFNDLEAEDRVYSLEEKDALEEVRLAIEHVVIPKGEHMQILPRPPHIISLQIDMIERYKLKWEKVGQELDARLVIFPRQSDTREKRRADKVSDSGNEAEDMTGSYDISGSQNGVARLPLLPE